MEANIKESNFKHAFEKIDSSHSGQLKSVDELKSFCELLIKEYKYSEFLISSINNEIQTTKKALTYQNLYSVFEKHLLIDNINESNSPAAKLIILLKQIKPIEGIDEFMKGKIDQFIDKLAQGKIYLDSDQGTYMQPYKKLNEFLPKLANPEIQPITLQQIEEYENSKKPKNDAIQHAKNYLKEFDTIDLNDYSELVLSIDSLNFSPFEFMKAFEREKTLPLITYLILKLHDGFTIIDESAFALFIENIRSGYKQDNPFHNDLHAADVLQMCHFMLTQGGLKDELQLDKIDEISLLLAAAVHDFRHPGLTNAFLMNTGHDLAITYNDVSILENYHVSQTFELIRKTPGCNIFSKLTQDQIKTIRKRMIQGILSTDMAKHFDIVNQLDNLIKTNSISNGINSDKVINKKTPQTEFDSKQFIFNACLHAADIGNPCRPFPIVTEWTIRCLNEFWNQGDLEKSLKIPVSFLCDRNTTSMPGSQVGFIAGIEKPLFEKLVQIYPKFKPVLDNLINSEKIWKEKAEAEKAKK